MAKRKKGLNEEVRRMKKLMGENIDGEPGSIDNFLNNMMKDIDREEIDEVLAKLQEFKTLDHLYEILSFNGLTFEIMRSYVFDVEPVDEMDDEEQFIDAIDEDMARYYLAMDGTKVTQRNTTYPEHSDIVLRWESSDNYVVFRPYTTPKIYKGQVESLMEYRELPETAAHYYPLFTLQDWEQLKQQHPEVYNAHYLVDPDCVDETNIDDLHDFYNTKNK